MWSEAHLIIMKYFILLSLWLLVYSLIPPHLYPAVSCLPACRMLTLLRTSTFQGYMVASQLLFCQLKTEQRFFLYKSNGALWYSHSKFMWCDYLTSASAFNLENSPNNPFFFFSSSLCGDSVYQGVYVYTYPEEEVRHFKLHGISTQK